MEEMCNYECDFCEAFTNTGDIGKTAEFEKNLEKFLPSRTIFESEHFAVIASIGQLSEGYLLLISKEHYHSMAHLEEKHYEELELLYSKIKLLLSNVYVNPIIFEHGPMPFEKGKKDKAMGGGSCVDHAHFHFVPVSISSTNLISFLSERFTSHTISNLNELQPQAYKNMPYFFIETHNGKRYIFDTPIPPPSQYIRKLISIEIGEPKKWNWRIYPELERVVATVKQLNDYIYGRS